MTPFKQGLEDRLAGKAFEACPFKPQTKEFEDWRRGWLIASTSSRLRPQGPDQSGANPTIA